MSPITPKPRFRTQPQPVAPEPEYDDSADVEASQLADDGDPEDADEGVITAEDIKKITDKADLPDGLYQMAVIGARYFKPTEEKPFGGYSVSLRVVAGPDHVEMPASGWPILNDRFKRIYNATAKDLIGVNIDEERMKELLKHTGAESLLGTGSATFLQLLKGVVGEELLVSISHRSYTTKSGEERTDMKFRYRALSND